MQTITSVILAILGICAIITYFIPTIIASTRNHHNTRAIMALNILLGWTLVGWTVALVWSLAVTGGNPEVKDIS
ncbi:MAG: superinfection immunity protein [SAR324 cluster bacterium]|nr:superinfection immunity protein [SAR324 cluster bacterium]MCZ6728759.1 superinfection immunity protein [SAR324 cluster bacterium]